MIVPKSVINKIHRVEFSLYEPTSTTVLWAYPVGQSYDYRLFLAGQWTSVSEGGDASLLELIQRAELAIKAAVAATEGAETVNAALTGSMLTITDREGNTTSLDLSEIGGGAGVGFDVLTLGGNNGTLSDEQIELVKSDHCIIIRPSEDASNSEKYYFKAYDSDTGCDYYCGTETRSNDSITRYYFTVDYNDKEYTFGSAVDNRKRITANPNIPSGSNPDDLETIAIGFTNYTIAAGKYTMPLGGIPASDLASAVQTSLGKADTAIQDISGKADKVVVVDGSTLPASLDPNKVYQLGTLTGSVTIPAFSSVAAGDTEAKIWCFTFSTSTTAPTITWPAGITGWSGGSAPTINASKSYEVTVMDGIAVLIEA